MMKISKIEVKNFKGVSHASFVPDKINILSGPNGSGKTSIIEAIRSGITGKLPPDVLKTATVNGYVDIALDEAGVIRRIFGEGNTKTYMCGKPTTAKSVSETLHELYGSKETMNIMFASELMSSMMGTDMAKYLLNEGFLKNEMTLDKLLDLCTLSKEAEDELRLMLPGAPETISLADIQEAYEMYAESRKIRKRELKEAEVNAKYEGLVPERSLSQVNADLEVVSTEIGKLTAASESYEKLKKAYDTHMANLRSFEEKLAQYRTVKAPSKTEDEILTTKLQENEKLTREVEASIRVCKSDIASLNKILDALNKPICPISSKLVCSTDKTSVRSELEAQVAEKETLLKTQSEKLEALAAEKAELETRRAEYNKRVTDYKAKLFYTEQLEKEKAFTISEPVKPDVSKLPELKTQLVALRSEMEIILKYNKSVEAQRRVEILTKQVQIYEEIVNELSPKGGVRQKVLEYSVAPLQEYCNDKMPTVLPKYSLTFDVSDGLRVMLVDNENGESINFTSASTGEQIRVAYILMTMFNELNQFGVMILDNLNELDDESCEKLMTLIQTDEEAFDHVFLSSANDNVKKAADKLGIKYVDVLTTIEH